MAAISNSGWRAVAIVAAIAIVVSLVVFGYAIWGVAILLLLLVMGGGARLYNRAGPPTR